MRALLLACLMLAGIASAESPAADPPPADSITLTRAQMDAMEKQLQEIVNRREKAAFEAGVQHQRQACASLI